jgi:hypothetical protein
MLASTLMVALLFSLLSNQSANGFLSGRIPSQYVKALRLDERTPMAPRESSLCQTYATSGVETTTSNAAPTNETDDIMAIRSPLRFIGPYPALALSFPNLATPAQRARGASGVTLDFVIDTAANVNTINAAVAKELGLEAVGQAPGGVGASGALASGGTTFMLGDVQFADVAASERMTFMGGLTASSLPVASPAAAGLLSVAFLFSFPGGFEICWGNQAAAPEAGALPSEVNEPLVKPSITFFGDLVGTESITHGLAQVPARQLESGLVAVTLVVNGVELPALLDTGSPITVLNAAAAKAVGLELPSSAVDAPTSTNEQVKDAAALARSSNPFARFAASVKADVEAKQATVAAQAAAQAAAQSGEVLALGGPNGQRIELRRLPAASSVELGGAQLDGSVRCYVGELPGLAALDGLGAAAGPAAVLGTDILRRRSRLVLQDGKVYV